MNNNIDIAQRATRYYGMSAKIAKKSGTPPSGVSLVLNGVITSGPTYEKVIKCAAKEVLAYEKKLGIGPGRPVQGE